MSKREKNKVTWVNHIDGWEKSGLTLVTYCTQHKINQSTLHYWRDKLGEKSKAPAGKLIPVRTTSYSQFSEIGIKGLDPDFKFSYYA